MAKSGAGTKQAGVAARLFTEHPRSLGMSWAGHAAGALRISADLLAAGAACFVHAIIPGWFTETAGRTITRLHALMQHRRATEQEWPEYEI